MLKSMIQLADGSLLHLHEGDTISILRDPNYRDASLDKTLVLEEYNGSGKLYPSIVEFLYTAKFFYLNNNKDIIYSASSIVKICDE